MLPQMEPGYYSMLYDLSIHKKAGLSYAREKKILAGGESVEVYKVKHLKCSVWGQVEEGWICMYMNNVYYVRKASKK